MVILTENFSIEIHGQELKFKHAFHLNSTDNRAKVDVKPS